MGLVVDRIIERVCTTEDPVSSSIAVLEIIGMGPLILDPIDVRIVVTVTKGIEFFAYNEQRIEDFTFDFRVEV
jgi:hypothetical protein